MRRVLIVVAGVGLTVLGCSGSDSPSGTAGLEINGPAVVDMTTIAVVPDASTADSSPDGSDASGPDATGDIVTTPPTDDIVTSAAPPVTFAPYESATYADPSNWICRADGDDVCDTAYPSTAVAGDLTLTTDPSTPATYPPADCFYVYPTVSGDAGMNSDLVADAEIGTTELQVARFNQRCALWVPIYRSVTTGGLISAITSGGDGFGEAWGLAYADVLDAWRYYLANLNHGRPVVLLGHSQGSFHLTQLLREEIDPNPAQRALVVSAIIPGSAFQVAPGQDVGGDTQHMPLCRSTDQTGCVITFATYRADAPPEPGALFGGPGELAAACVNPAALAGGPGALDGSYPTSSWIAADPARAPTIDTPRMSAPGLVSGSCQTTADGWAYLAVTVDGDPADPRADDIVGDGIANWGLHTIDMNVAQDTVIDLVGKQIAAFTSS